MAGATLAFGVVFLLKLIVDVFAAAAIVIICQFEFWIFLKQHGAYQKEDDSSEGILTSSDSAP